MAASDLPGLLTTYELTVRACVRIHLFADCHSEIHPSWHAHLEKLTNKKQKNDFEMFQEQRLLKSNKVSAEILSDYSVAVKTYELRLLRQPKSNVDAEVLDIKPFVHGETNLTTFWKAS